MNLPRAELDTKTSLDLWVKEHSDYAKEQIILSNQGIVLDCLSKGDFYKANKKESEE